MSVAESAGEGAARSNPPSDPKPVSLGWRGVAAVCALLAAHYALALGGTWEKSLTFDETAHITAGYAYWRFGDYRLQPENGNLPQRLAALPLVLFDRPTFPSREQTAWRESDVWEIGGQFLHTSGNDLTAILRHSRAAMTLLSASLCLAVFLWARAIHGTAGGFVALSLCAFTPLLLAHGPLATSDAAASLFFLLAARSLWALLGRVSAGHLLACAGSLSGLALSKTSAVLALPMAALTVPAALLARAELTVALPGDRLRTIVAPRRRAAVMTGALLVCLAAAWLAVWAAFSFRFLPVPPEDQATFAAYLGPGVPVTTVEGVSALAGTPGRLVAFAARLRLLPEAFLYGTSYVFAALERYAFFNGELSTGGWRTFFPYCFLVKSTIPMLLLCATAVLVAAVAAPGRRSLPARESPAPGWGATAPLWIFLAVYGASLLTSTINLGARHALPAYPAIFVLLGGAARWRGSRRLQAWLLLLLLWNAAEALRGFPHYIAYFNQFTGRRHAWRHLVDSSLDWGQDLPGLKAWLDRRPESALRRPVYLAYFGTGRPASYGIAAEPLALDERLPGGLPPLRAGTYCVSATEIQAVYYPVHGRWNSRYENAYRDLLAGGRGEEIRWAGEGDARVKLARLATARLLAYLREREPEAMIGYSILCHDLSEDDLRRAFDGPPPEMPGTAGDGAGAGGSRR